MRRELDVLGMIHDGVLSRMIRDAQATDRRQAPRVPFPTELIVRWFSDIVYGFPYQQRPEPIEQQAAGGDEQEDPCHVPGAKAAWP